MLQYPSKKQKAKERKIVERISKISKNHEET
jgi:hypothetical protein